jgi:Uma2 family endonuclease
MTTETMTGAQFDALAYEEGRRWELLDGDLIPVASPTLDHQEIVFLILSALKQYLRGKAGIASHDVEFGLAPDTRVRPDVWATLGDKALRLDRTKVPVPGCPDLAVEVISPTERTTDSMRKVDAYLRSGTSEVWQVYPQTRQVIVHRQGEMRKLSVNDVIETPLLPGFSIPVAAVFLA